MVATDMSLFLLRWVLERSFALEIRLGTSVRREELIGSWEGRTWLTTKYMREP